MLQRLFVDNYKSLANFTLKFDHLALLVGANGAGKTSVCDIIFALRELLRGVSKVTDAGIFPTSTLTRWQNRNLQILEVEVALHGETFEYRLEIEHERKTRRARIVLEQLTGGGQPLFRCERAEVQLFRDNHSAGPVFRADWTESALARVPAGDDNTRLTSFLDFMRNIIVCGIRPSSCAVESSTEDPMLARDASNFAGWYRHMVLERQELVPRFTEALKAILVGLVTIRLEKVGLDTRAVMLVFEDHGVRYELRFDELSDGQRALIVLYALVCLTENSGCAIFLDEPANFIALREIQPWLMELKDACGNTVPQAVLCSHHPELIDYLGEEAGILLRREASGVTSATRLATAVIADGLPFSEILARGWEL